MTTHSATLTGYAPECVCTVQDDALELLGYVVVDASIAGHACGGLRMHNDLSIEELKHLARSMTLKYGFNYMPQGGAKAGIVADPDLPVGRRHRLLNRFGQLIAPLLRSGYYHTGPDMNITADDVDQVLQGAGVRLPASRKGKGKKSGLYTAMAVMVAAEAAASAMQTCLEGKTIAIEGFGAVGSALAMLMTRKKKATIVAVSTTKGAIYNPAGLDVEQLLRLRERYGNSVVTMYAAAEKIDNEDLLGLDVDILSPCARQFPITADNACRVRAPLVCPGANNPVTPDAEEILAQRKILSIPHFAANCGGVLGNKVEVLGMGEEFIEAYIRERNFSRIRAMVLDALDSGLPMAGEAELEAMSNFARMRHLSEQAGMSSTVHRLGLRVFNSGFLPAFLIRPVAPLYLDRFMKIPGK